ncbi:3-isopropylmalate dehydratase [Acidovorax sp. Root219]|uniref:LeuD/DmdB family oxidoreductase small subunit n=1 Tax=Acidovorax sp. Root219 TaxID=1736493 RepID=UPI000709042F|nr:3-isopropylmalate dehydratase [Acidovorax sp. Root219]KRC26424.1 3-isopropylmalate dehydratase [Acidovorax sp. Root219]
MNAALHRVWKLGADIDTDVLAPGHAMKHGIDVLARHCLESVRPDFVGGAGKGDVIVAGPNFGIGSSREQAAAVLVRLGVVAVIAPSFSGLYFRNAFNLGLLLLTCPQADQVGEGEQIALDWQAPAVITADGTRLACDPIPPFLMDMVRAGGLMNQLRTRFGKEAING